MIVIKRVSRLKGDSQIKAFVDVLVGDVMIYGAKVIQGKNGLFMGLPQNKGKDGKWYPIVKIERKEILDSVQAAVIDAYEGGAQPGPEPGADEEIL